MDKKEQIKRFNSNLMMPGVDIDIRKLPHDLLVSEFILYPTDLQHVRGSFVAPSHTLALVVAVNEPIYYELGCIVLLFTKLLLPNIVYYYRWNINVEREILLHRLEIIVRKILQLSEVLERKIFYEKYKDNLGVDLEE